jgi:hypothetical protein
LIKNQWKSNVARGGKRNNSGRPTGSRNKITAANGVALVELAAAYTEEMLDLLVGLARGGESESARIAAIIAILDRGNGKPTQAVEVSGKGGGPIESREVSDIEAARQIPNRRKRDLFALLTH